MNRTKLFQDPQAIQNVYENPQQEFDSFLEICKSNVLLVIPSYHQLHEP